MELSTILILIFLVLNLLLLVILLNRTGKSNENLSLPQITSEFERVSDKSEEKIKNEFSRNREESSNQSRQSREELMNSFKKLEDSLISQIKNFSERLDKLIDTLDQRIESFTKMTREDSANFQRNTTETLIKQLSEASLQQKHELNLFSEKLEKLISMNEQKFENLKEKVEGKLNSIQEANTAKLEEMRITVDEKLHSTLEKRLGESFQLVSERLELVHKGLGEMQNLASGVGDLKKVLTNVKARGTWGEIQLENLIEQILTQEQYSKNVPTKKGSNDRVEFAIKMPGRGRDKGDVLWLPIDAKFPMEDYQRLVTAQEVADVNLIEEASKALENRIKSEAKSISEKYIDPPNTTDVALLFLPVESLYAEVLRRPGLFEKIQNDFKVILTGPTTLTAILNSLQMGFKTLVIEKRSSEVWNLLGGVKTDFSKFGDILDKTYKKLQEASNTIEDAAKKTRTIERKLRNVQELPASNQEKLLPDSSDEE
ncbi:MAG TPA: DNA recombination protein RmuC [Ignavibacteriaceae bacterium]|nr:DNA recombination protein RmuC [Ignavibacteriaceae bacterium]